MLLAPVEGCKTNDSVSLRSQKSKVLYYTDTSNFCMSQLQLVSQWPSDSLEHSSARMCALVSHVAEMQNEAPYELVLNLTGMVLGLPELRAL